MKSNQYVYPSVPFADLSNKEFKAEFKTSKNISTKNLKNLVNSIHAPSLKIQGSSTAEKILNIFLNKEILFGPKSYVSNNSAYWLKLFQFYIKQNKPLELTILGFPFKMPVPIKTDRTLPDMGEVLSLKRLYDLTNIISSVYEPGANVTVVTEGVFGRFNKMKKSEYDSYKNLLASIIKKFGWDNKLRIVELEEMEKLSANFPEQFDKKVSKLKKLFENRDKNILKKYNGAKQSISRIINTRDLNIDQIVLMDVYNNSIKNHDTSSQVVKLRKYIKDMTHDTLLQYHAYLMVRDDLKFIEKTVPHAITLSVSPKPNRLGIIPVNKECIRLPYHGVPVYHLNTKTFTIEYLIDLLRMKKTFQKVYWEEDKERKPFYYIEI